jgi:hypothetical protein
MGREKNTFPGRVSGEKSIDIPAVGADRTAFAGIILYPGSQIFQTMNDISIDLVFMA